MELTNEQNLLLSSILSCDSEVRDLIANNLELDVENTDQFLDLEGVTNPEVQGANCVFWLAKLLREAE